MIKNVFFDFNGTILDDLDLCYDLLLSSCKDCNVKPVSMETYRTFFDFPVKNYYEKIGFDWTKVDYEKVAAPSFISKYNKRWSTETHVFEDFVPLCKKLKEQGIKIYLLSASEKTMLEEQLKFFGIFDLFDGISSSENIHASGKIDYGNQFIEKNNINRDETLLIGDTVYDFKVAEALKLKSVLFSKGHNTKEKLLTTGTIVIDNLLDLIEYIK